jgi:hypothetical protein
MKRTDDSEINEGNAFYMIACLGTLIAWAIIIFVIDKVLRR